MRAEIFTLAFLRRVLLAMSEHFSIYFIVLIAALSFTLLDDRTTERNRDKKRKTKSIEMESSLKGFSYKNLYHVHRILRHRSSTQEEKEWTKLLWVVRTKMRPIKRRKKKTNNKRHCKVRFVTNFICLHCGPFVSNIRTHRSTVEIMQLRCLSFSSHSVRYFVEWIAMISSN